MDTEKLFDVAGKVAIVTGGSRGIGHLIAEGLVRAGARVYICSRKSEDLTQAAENLGHHGYCVPIPCDVSDEASVEAMVGRVGEAESRLDILINNAGITWGEQLDAFPVEQFDRVLSTNITAPFIVARSAVPLMRRSASDADPGRIINIGSTSGIRVPPKGTNDWAYSASKAAVHMLTSHLARDLVHERITVNAIAPGMFASRMTKFVVDDEERLGKLVRRLIPMGRLGRGEDIAGAVIYLCSRASSYVTGIVLPVDGGVLL